jgi:hypothetical protein
MWQMVSTRTSEDSILDIPEGLVRPGSGQVRRDSAPPPPRPPVSPEQLLATQNDLMRRLVGNDEHHGAECQQPQHQERDSSYLDFLSTHPPVFADVTDPLEADSWLRTKESKFGRLHCTDIKRLYMQHSNFEAQLEPGGLPTSPLYLLITMFRGMSYVLLSMHFTYLQVCSALS